MRFLHTSYLHLGKRVNGFSMIDEQRNILTRLVRVAVENDADAVIIAGDIYDKTQPSAEAVSLFDDFLCELFAAKKTVLAISGNHDSADRVAYGKRLFAGEGVFLSRPYDGDIQPVHFEDEYGKLNVFLLPYIKPSDVRNALDEDVCDYDAAVRAAISRISLDESERNVIVAHQFVTGAALSDSEEMSVGGLENVGADAFSTFDYAALGHIHRAQSMAGGRIRYSGTPLKYSLSEVNQVKSASIVDVLEKDKVEISEIELKPLRDMRRISGSFAELMNADAQSEDWLEISLTDEREIPDAIRKLRLYYPNTMKLTYENIVRKDFSAGETSVKRIGPTEMFTQFFKKVNGRELCDDQREYVEKIMREISEDML